MIEGSVFIGAAIIAITQAIKEVAPKVSGAVSIVVAVAVGIVIALIDKEIGIVDLTVAQGILTALGAAGVVTVATKV